MTYNEGAGQPNNQVAWGGPERKKTPERREGRAFTKSDEIKEGCRAWKPGLNAEPMRTARGWWGWGLIGFGGFQRRRDAQVEVERVKCLVFKSKSFTGRSAWCFVTT